MTDALSGLLMGVPEPSFGAHMLTEDILMASSRGTAGRSSIQSITHHALAPTHVVALFLSGKSHRDAQRGSRCKHSTYCRKVKCRKTSTQYTTLNMTISKNIDLRVNSFYTHDIMCQKEQRSGLKKPQAFCISIITYVNTSKHNVLWASTHSVCFLL